MTVCLWMSHSGPWNPLLFALPAACVARLSLAGLMSCHSHIGSDASFIIPVLLLISLFFSPSLAGSGRKRFPPHLKVSIVASTSLYPSSPALLCAPVVIPAPCFTSFFLHHTFKPHLIKALILVPDRKASDQISILVIILCIHCLSGLLKTAYRYLTVTFNYYYVWKWSVLTFCNSFFFFLTWSFKTEIFV